MLFVTTIVIYLVATVDDASEASWWQQTCLMLALLLRPLRDYAEETLRFALF